MPRASVGRAIAGTPVLSRNAGVILAVQVLEELGWATYDYASIDEEALARLQQAMARHPESDLEGGELTLSRAGTPCCWRRFLLKQLRTASRLRPLVAASRREVPRRNNQYSGKSMGRALSR